VQDGFRGRIHVISGETYLPYDRIHLSKTLRTDPALLRDAAFYTAANIEVGALAPLWPLLRITLHSVCFACVCARRCR
jgi:NAD(P)H-nitrite reductase large subunit